MIADGDGAGALWEVEEERVERGDSKGGEPRAIGENLQLSSDWVLKMSH